MIRNMEKHAAIIEFNRLLNEPAGAKISILLDVLIDEARKENDTVAVDQIRFNQGKIAAYVRLKEYLERGK